MRKFKNMKISGLLALAMVLVLLVGSLAYFADRATEDASFSTATVDITTDPDDPNEDNLTAKWLAVNPKVKTNFNPGDKVDLSYTLANTGELAVDVRETFVITSSKPMTAGDPQFQLFTSFTTDSAGANDGKDVVVTENRIDATHYMYSITSYSLNGSEETVSGVNANSVAKTYYLVFDKLAGNDFQGATCTIDYLVEAKQHSDGANDWTTAATGNLTLGGQTVKAVPAA